MFVLEEATIADIQAAVAAKIISYRELVMMYLERIAEVDSCENGYNSVLEINPDALTIAQIMDDERAKGILKGSLHGIPILLKDNINTWDKMNTSAGSMALAEHFACCADADIVQSLRNGGAIILGKTNMTEFANWMTQDMPNGYSSRGGQVKNPYNSEADPSGSSTGSAVAVSANLCAVSVGTETHGSIIAPAFSNGIVGIKPTAGLLSSFGIIPISNTLDTAGPMARTVKDAAILLTALKDSAINQFYRYGIHHMDFNANNQGKDYTMGLEGASLRGMRIGIYGEKNSEDSEFNTALEEAVSAIENAGAIVTRDIPNITPEEPWHYFGKFIAKHEFKRCMDYHLASYSYSFHSSGRMKSLKDIVDYNKANSEICLKYGQTILQECLDESRPIHPEYIKALRRRETAISDLDKIFTSNNLDILVGASEHMGIAPLTGFPSGTIPVNIRENAVPIGLYFIARRFDELTLIRVMYAVEQLIGKRNTPK